MQSLILGAHMSAAGGAHKAIERADEVGCDCVQLFLNPPQSWPRTSPKKARRRRDPTAGLELDDVDNFKNTLRESGIVHTIAHSCYLANVASPDRELRKKSIDALVVEVHRADQLGIPFVVLHPGAFTTSSEETGLQRVVSSMNEIEYQTRQLTTHCLLENTAGQGTCLGATFEHLGTILDRVKVPERLGICFDTCHAFAAGYPMATLTEYRQTMRWLKQTVGLDRVKAFHINDSKREFGSRVDRHEHIGKGHVGINAFARLVNDRRFRKVPMYLETPKGRHPKSAKPWDVINLRRIRRLVGRPIA